MTRHTPTGHRQPHVTYSNQYHAHTYRPGLGVIRRAGRSAVPLDRFLHGPPVPPHWRRPPLIPNGPAHAQRPARRATCQNQQAKHSPRYHAMPLPHHTARTRPLRQSREQRAAHARRLATSSLPLPTDGNRRGRQQYARGSLDTQTDHTHALSHPGVLFLLFPSSNCMLWACVG